MSKRKLEIDRDTADLITVINLKDHRKYLRKELADHKKGSWLHPEDVDNHARVIKALDLIINHYGG